MALVLAVHLYCGHQMMQKCQKVYCLHFTIIPLALRQSQLALGLSPRRIQHWSGHKWSHRLIVSLVRAGEKRVEQPWEGAEIMAGYLYL